VREGIFLIATSLVVILLQVTSLGFLVPMEYKPDLMLVIVIWASLRVRLQVGMVFAFCSGLVMDFLSGSSTGVFALIYSVCFVACGFFNAPFAVDRPAGRMVAASIATVLAGAAVLFMRWASGPVDVASHVAVWIAAKSLTTGLACLVAFPVMDRMWAGYLRFTGAQ
jgi:rod shape-determining protein MreD